MLDRLISFFVSLFLVFLIIVTGFMTFAYTVLAIIPNGEAKPTALTLSVLVLVSGLVSLKLWNRRYARRCAVSVPVQPRRTQTKPRAQKWVGEVLIDAHADLQRNGFRCVSCRKGHAIAEAALIMVERYDEEDEDLRTVWHHRYRGLLCPKCAGTLSRIQSERHRFLAIPPEFRE